MAAAEFISLWLSGANDTTAHDQLSQLLDNGGPLYGRIIHGLNEEDFDRLSTDKWKRLSWIFGPDALHHFLGRNLVEVCLFLGFGSSWIEQKVSQEVMFKLCIFPETGVEMCEQATWNGIFTLLEHTYPETWPYIRTYKDIIINTPFQEIEELAGYSMKAVNMIGRDPNTGDSTDPRYMTLKKLLYFFENSSLVRENSCENISSAEEKHAMIVFRQFLFDELGVKELFTGNGMTLSDDPEKHPSCREYLTRTIPLREIPGCVLIQPDMSSLLDSRNLHSNNTTRSAKGPNLDS